jgi:hypothetical protein
MTSFEQLSLAEFRDEISLAYLSSNLLHIRNLRPLGFFGFDGQK